MLLRLHFGSSAAGWVGKNYLSVVHQQYLVLFSIGVDFLLQVWKKRGYNFE